MLLVVLTVTTLIGVAIVKPWSRPTPSALPPLLTVPLASSPPVASGSPAPSRQPGPSSPPVPLDETTVEAALANAPIAPRDAWGIRAMIVQPRSVSEVWVELGRRGTATLGENGAFEWLGEVGAIFGIGVTTPLSDLPLDVRIWRQVASGWQALEVSAIAPARDPSSRLLLLASNGQFGTPWPGGTYRIDLLQEHGVRHLQVTLSGVGVAVEPPKPRDPPSAAQLQATVAAPGAFIASGTNAGSYLSAGLPVSSDGQQRDAGIWLALRPEQVFSPGVSHPIPAVVGTANLLGVAVDQGQSLVAAWLTMVAPISRDLGMGQLISVNDSGNGRGVQRGARLAVAVWHAPDVAAGFPAGSYRIDALLVQGPRPMDQSWDVSLLSSSQGTESPLLPALRSWSEVNTQTWAAMAPGHRTSLTPSTHPGIPQDPGPSCDQGADLGLSPQYVGVTHPGPAFDAVAVYRLGFPDIAGVPVQFSQLVAGLLVVRPIESDWPPGRYAIAMRTGSETEQVTICAR